jgi:hypothetical protein
MVEVEGARQLRATLKQAGEDLGQLKEANAAAARIAANASADLAPRRTGRLQATIRASGTNTAGIVRAGTKRAPYAQAVHWGRVFWPNARSPRRARSKTTAQPFISKGARGSEGQWLPLYEKQLETIIEKVKGK